MLFIILFCDKIKLYFYNIYFHIKKIIINNINFSFLLLHFNIYI